MPFVHNESTTHRLAKHRLADWLAATPAARAGEYRVAVEHPFSKCGLGVVDWCALGYIFRPTYREMSQTGKPPLYICDIVLIENDQVTHAIEVVHTSPTTDDKIRWLRSYEIATYEAYADQVMALKGPPMDFESIMREELLRPIPQIGSINRVIPRSNLALAAGLRGLPVSLVQ